MDFVIRAVNWRHLGKHFIVSPTYLSLSLLQLVTSNSALSRGSPSLHSPSSAAINTQPELNSSYSDSIPQYLQAPSANQYSVANNIPTPTIESERNEYITQPVPVTEPSQTTASSNTLVDQPVPSQPTFDSYIPQQSWSTTTNTAESWPLYTTSITTGFEFSSDLNTPALSNPQPPTQVDNYTTFGVDINQGGQPSLAQPTFDSSLATFSSGTNEGQPTYSQPMFMQPPTVSTGTSEGFSRPTFDAGVDQSTKAINPYTVFSSVESEKVPDQQQEDEVPKISQESKKEKEANETKDGI